MNLKNVLRAHGIAVQMRALSQTAEWHQCAEFMQHGSTSCLLHCVAVAFYSSLLLDNLHISYSRDELIRGALLHDFFLYDWHNHKTTPGEPMHAFSHPSAALRNARKRIRLTKKEEDIILRHMFPVTIIPPGSREALVVCLVDKLCAVYESFHSVRPYPLLNGLYRSLPHFSAQAQSL